MIYPAKIQIGSGEGIFLVADGNEDINTLTQYLGGFVKLHLPTQHDASLGEAVGNLQ